MADIQQAIREVSAVVKRDGSISTSNRWLQVLDASTNLDYVRQFLIDTVDGKRKA